MCSILLHTTRFPVPDLLPARRIIEMGAVLFVVTAHALHDRRPGRVLLRILHMGGRRPMTALAPHSRQFARPAAPRRNKSTSHAKRARMTLLTLRVDVKPRLLQRRERPGMPRPDPRVVIPRVTL